MSIVAVITGDIIRSSQIEKAERVLLLEHLEQIFKDLHREVSPNQSEIFRGDSFQLLLDKAEKALLAALLIRAGLKRRQYEGQEGRLQADARISIGIGELSYRGEKPGVSDGEAFHLSGRALDKMKKRNSLTIKTVWPEVNEEMEVASVLSEAITGRWTQPQAAIIYTYLLNNKTQQELADEFGITQGAVSQRLNESGHVDAMKIFLQRFEKVIREKL